MIFMNALSRRLDMVNNGLDMQLNAVLVSLKINAVLTISRRSQQWPA